MGLFDRLFGQEENQSQETVANQEISETEALDNQDLSTSEGTVSYTHLTLPTT